MDWCTSLMAHHPDITAEATRKTNSGCMINYTATSSKTTGEPESGNTQIDIILNKVVVYSGRFSDPEYSFSGSFPAPKGAVEGDSVAVTAYSAAEWDNGGAS
ncbi:hypothetical protein CXF72_04055 [Psychromonas sp. MB-3u-54]|uniref:hypothetical protein n=1 Tax=Psychromonas sp. MB-3u-54 TaxID=2058319 RepID=UPI000CA84025|nr:hypothetical protein [Psychromonas sp. MB-3u-54]PKH03847.1 hypothetical protein CXF72_04055 [Psychromonas sp. MB-3u-54]